MAALKEQRYDQQASQLLIEALRKNVLFYDEIADCLALGACPDVRLLFNHTGLHRAVTCNNPDVLKLLLGHEVEIDARGTGGYTALHYAAESGNEACVRLLLEAGANPHIPAEYGSTPIGQVNNTSWKPAIAQMLLDAGADLEVRDDEWMTPLMRTLDAGNEEAALFMVDAGADLYARDINGRSIVHLCSRYEMFQLQADLFKLGVYIDEKCRKLTWPHAQWDKAQNTWKKWQETGADVANLQGWMMAQFGNIGKLDEVLKPAIWRGHEAHLAALMQDLPPYLQRQIAKAQPELMAMLTNPQPIIHSWDAQMVEKEASHGRE